LFDQFYQDAGEVAFDDDQPWTMFIMPAAGFVVAGLNSTMADSHREEDHYGWLGAQQVEWFDAELRRFARADWWRIGVLGHPAIARSGSTGAAGALRDANRLRALHGQLDVLLDNNRRHRSAALVSLSDGRVTTTELDIDRTA
jgi:hypothetical protein